MTGLKLTGATAFLFGGAAPILGMIEPKDLEGLGPSALSTIVSVSSLALAIYLIRNLVPAINEQTKALTINNERQRELCDKIDRNPCLLQEAVAARREAAALVDEAERKALLLVDSARVDALRVIEEAKRSSHAG